MVSPTESQRPVTPVAMLSETVGRWPGVSLALHQEQAIAIRMDDKTFGHLRSTGWVSVSVPHPIREVLLDEGTARLDETRSGEWIGVPVDSTEDVDGATLLLRLAYLYRRILRSRDAAALHDIRAELARRPLSEPLHAVFEAMLAKRNDTLPSLPFPQGSERRD